MEKFNVYIEEDCVILECEDCGRTVKLTHREFEEMVQEGLFELVDDEDDECDCEECSEYDECHGYDEEDDDIIDELELELFELLEEMKMLREEGDYEGYLLLADAYATLFLTIYE